ncbi:hypothetical protein NXV20_09425 [Bacteroides thetaiotaomicron]|uniref:hypothetical protein n=1 Tax=Bacteroides thetaiotaomicron TaxID=818 RepID=UPI002165DB05|nr:hypothetical protein [Bacteroides thetaiotaomicron]MCS2826427.1 hypothetical protein [Bacteroides thetaiotaomicron]
MDFQKVAACCADTVVIVRGTACRLSVSKPVEYDFRSAFNSLFYKEATAKIRA